MSNHSGSYLLNEIIGLLHREQVFTWLGKGRTQRIVLEMLDRATREYDCNIGEILKGHGATVGLCSYCRSPADDVVEDLCRECRAKLGS
jgi:hypothetical protein